VGGEWEVSFTINSSSSVDLIARGGEWEGSVRLRQGLGKGRHAQEPLSPALV
jgi:hypothetical protein